MARSSDPRPGRPRAEPVRRELRATSRARERGARRVATSAAALLATSLSGAALASRAELPEPAPIVAAAALAAAALIATWGLASGLRAERAAAGARVELERVQTLFAATVERGAPPAHPFRGALESSDDLPPAPVAAEQRGSRWIAAGIGAAALCALLLGLLLSLDGPEQAVAQRWTFTEDVGDLAALGLSAPVAEAGAWELSEHEHATGGRALLNRSGSGATPAIVIAAGVNAQDVRVGTRCQVTSGDAARACGLVFRYRDPSSYAVARIDYDRGEVALARIEGGEERALGATRVSFGPGWNELVVEARDGDLRVAWNGSEVLSAADAGPSAAGAVGLWVPAEGSAHFDELSVRTLAPAEDDAGLWPLFLGPRAS